MKYRRRAVSSDRRFSENKGAGAFGAIDRIPDHFFFPDSAPAERWQHSGRLLEMTARAGVLLSRASEECVLDVLFVAGHLNQRLLTAGLRLRADYLGADLAAHLAGSYNPARVATAHYTDRPDRSDRQEEAYQRWRGAVCAIGSMFNDIVVTVTCHDITPDDAQLTLLQVGLVKLAAYYGIPKTTERRLSEDVNKTAARQVRVDRRGIGDSRGERGWLH